MKLEDLLDMDMGEVIDWILENKDDYVLVKKEDLDEDDM